MLRYILLIHESKTIRAIIRNYVMSELSDVSIVEVSSPQQSLEEFDDIRYDIVFSGREMSGMDGFTLIRELRSSSLNSETPFVMVSSGTVTEEILSRLEEGKEFYLTMPFSPHDLSILVNNLADPRRLRRFERVSIVGAVGQLHLENGDLEGEIVNISENGVLCDVINKEGHNDILRDLHMSIFFPMRYEHVAVKDVWCKLLRIVVLSWGPNNFPERLRIVWQFIDMAEVESEKLQGVIDKALVEQVIKNKI